MTTRQKEMTTRRFTMNNTPNYGFYGQPLPEALPEASSPPRIKRQSHEWSYYFGRFPLSCAAIKTDSALVSSIGKSGISITRHVYVGPVNSDLTLYPSDRDVFLAKKDVCEKIEMIKRQLDVFVEENILTYESKTSEIEIFMGEPIKLSFTVCDDTGMFHVVVGKPASTRAGPLHPEMTNLNKLIFVIRSIFDRNESPLCSNLEFEIEEMDWHNLQKFTIEPTEEYFPRKVLSLIDPALLGDELDDMEWCRIGGDESCYDSPNDYPF